MKCSMCGLEFDEQIAEASCKGCVLAKGCSMVRCPNCGFETPREPRWLQGVLNKLKGRQGDEADRPNG